MFERKSKNHERLAQILPFHQHKHGWSNRLFAGNSLLGKEGMEYAPIKKLFYEGINPCSTQEF